MTINEVRQFEKIMRKPGLSASSAATEVVEAIEEEPGTYAAFLSTVAMKARTGADYGVADASLKKALVDLRFLLSDEEAEALDVAQERWTVYRKALEVRAGLEFGGGTHAPLAALMARLTETKRRTAEVRSQVQERATR